MGSGAKYFVLGFAAALLFPFLGIGVLWGVETFGSPRIQGEKSSQISLSSGSQEELHAPASPQTISELPSVYVSGGAIDTTAITDTSTESGAILVEVLDTVTGAISSDSGQMMSREMQLRDEIERAAWLLRVRSYSGIVFPDFGMMLTEYDEDIKNNDVYVDDIWMSYETRFAPYRSYLEDIRSMDRARRSDWRDAVLADMPDIAHRPSPYPHIYSLIEIDISEQKMYAYEDGELIMMTSITSGKRGHDTIEGVFQVGKKQRNKLLTSPFADDPYRLWVDYWIPFAGAYGIHDACNSKNCWRTIFGGMDYKSRGSHGCVNTPYAGVKFLYDWAISGTSVYVHK